MATIVKVKRSDTSGNPAVLGAGELAYSNLANNGSNGGDRLYIGTGVETSGNAVNHLVIGGKYFTDMLDHTPGVLTNSSAVVTDATGKVDVIKAGNLNIATNIISSTTTNADIELTPNGTGKVRIANAFALPNIPGTDGYVLTTDGAGNSSWAAGSMSSIPGNMSTFLGTPSSANLLAAMTDETGTGKLVFATSPVLSTSVITDSSTFSAFNTVATTLNIGGAATALNLGAATGTTTVNNDLAAKGLTTAGHILPATDIVYDLGSTTKRFRDLYLSGSTINLGGATLSGSATGVALNGIINTPIGASSPSTGAFTTLNTTGDTVIGGNLTVNGTTTTVNSTTVTVDDKNIELGSVASPSDATADGGGITLKGLTDKTFNWVNATAAWTSSEDLNLLTGKVYEINGVTVLSAVGLGSNIVSSSLTSVGTIATGVWNGTAVTTAYGGTGLTTATSRGILFGNGTSTMGVTAASAVDGSFLRSDSSGNPYFSDTIDGGTY
jgi:hypothetical protein